jgi:hypothetical protein
VATFAGAQSLLLGDTDQDGELTIADVTKSVNMILGKEAQQTLTLDPYRVDNSMVAGTWYASDGKSFTFNADGTTTYSGGTTYEFMPSQGNLVVYDAIGLPVKLLPVVKVTSDYLLIVNHSTGAFTRYTSTKPVILVTGITLNKTSLSLAPGGLEKLMASVLPSNASNKSVEWSSSNPDVATVYSTGIVEATGSGTCTITCSATDGSGVKATCIVIIPHNRNDYVDLDLPSGTLCATCNIGADSPEDYGLYFAWGETTGYTQDTSDGRRFNWAQYQLCNGTQNTLTKYCYNSTWGYNGFTDDLTLLLPEDDAAIVNWGSDWRMPNITQFQELIYSGNTTTEWTTQNGVYGRLITSKRNGNTLFLPAAGSRNGTSLYYAGSIGYYLSRTLNTTDYPYYAQLLVISSSNIVSNSSFRYLGYSVRPVRAL